MYGDEEDFVGPSDLFSEDDADEAVKGASYVLRRVKSILN